MAEDQTTNVSLKEDESTIAINQLKDEIGNIKEMLNKLVNKDQPKDTSTDQQKIINNGSLNLTPQDLLTLLINIQKPKPDIEITKLKGNNFNEYKNDIVRYLTATNKSIYIEKSPEDNPNFNKQDDMQVQLVISNNCLPVIKNHIQLKVTNSSACEMWKFINTEYSKSSQQAINNAINSICDSQLSKSKSITHFINYFNNNLNVLEFNKYKIDDNLKIKLFFRCIGEKRNLYEPHCLNEQLSFSETVAYVRDNLQSMNETSGIVFSSINSNYNKEKSSNGNQQRKYNHQNRTNNPYKKDWRKYRYNRKFGKQQQKQNDDHSKDADKKDDNKDNQNKSGADVHSRIQLQANKKGSGELVFSLKWASLLLKIPFVY